MNTRAIVPQERAELAHNTIPPVDWRDALDTFLNTLSSPRTAKAYQRAVTEAMEALGVVYVADVTPPMLAQYRGGLMARLDTDSPDRLSPATANLRLAGVLVKMGKGRKDRLVPLAHSVMETVRVWVENSGRDLAQKADRETHLLTTRQSDRMTPTRAWQLVKALAAEAGIQKSISPHSLRHTMAIETLRGGGSPCAST